MKRGFFYPRLAWQGIVKNRALYLPYFGMGALMVAVYYIMVYLCSPQVVNALGAGATVQVVLLMGLGVIGVFSAIFLYYCNTFLIVRRMKEYGLYNVLGMGKWNIGCIMFFETLITLAITLVTGLAVGVSFARMAELIMIRILKAEIATTLFIRWDGVLRAVQGFGVIHLIILFINLLRMRLSNPIALLRAENAGEKPPKANWLIALLGMVLLGCGYYLAVTVESPSEAIFLFFAAVLLVMGGTYLLFIAGSVVVCKLLQKNRRYYYQTHHFISLSSMTFRMKRNGAGLATICILCTMVLVMLSATLCLYTGMEDMMRRIYPRNVTVQVGVQNSFDSDALAKRILEPVPAQDVLKLEGMSAMTLVKDGMVEKNENIMTTTVLYVYPLSLYKEMGGKATDLNVGEILYHPVKSSFRGDSLSFFGSRPYAMRRTDDLPAVFQAPSNLMTYDCLVLFAEDYDAFCADLLAHGDGLTRNLFLYFDSPLSGEEMSQMLGDIKGVIQDDLKALPKETVRTYRVQNEQTNRRDVSSLFGSLFFIGLVLGSVFSLAAALIIYYKQISEGFEDAGRFAMMRKVGLTDQEIHKSINSQVRTVFFAPLLLAGVHVLFALPMVKLLLGTFGMNNAALFYMVTLICFGLFALVYAAVYFMTSRTYYRIVR